MSLINLGKNFSEDWNLTALMKGLHALLDLRKKSDRQDENQYNYSYLNPLAATNVEEIKLPFIPIPIPVLSQNDRPSLQWIALVLSSLGILFLNNLSFDDDRKLQALRKIRRTLQTPKSPEELNDIVEQLELTFREIAANLPIEEKITAKAIQLPQIELAIETELQAIEDRFDRSQERIRDILLPVEESTLNKLKQIIQNTIELAELADRQVANLETSAGSSELADYDRQFRAIVKPKVADLFQKDEIFAYLQVAGYNPIVLQQFQGQDRRLPLTEKQYEAIAQKFGVSDSLAQAQADGRLYVADYALLDTLVDGSYISDTLQQQKYIVAPVALFAVPPAGSASRSLFPVAISYQKTPLSSDRVLFTPLDADRNGEPWMTAKNIVEVANSSHHELIGHLGRTHLVVEPFVVPTNNLPENHPLKNLLQPHFEGTVLINYAAHSLLVAPGGSVDALLASSIGGDHLLAIKGTQSYLFNFNEIAFPQTLKSRGVSDPDKLPIYPYRDDGLLIWNAIENWVRDYFSIYYPNDSSVLADADLQTWAATLVSFQGGRLHNFGDRGQGRIETLDYLVQAVATVIFTASAQHAAVNFPQKELMMYAPAFPLARYLPAPTNTQSSESFIKGLPSLSQAQNQINILYLLGSVYYTQLGLYLPSAFPADSKLEAALQKFQKELEEIEATIQQRNTNPERLIPYEFLLPSKIPQSINI